MGNLLGSPVTDKETHTGTTGPFNGDTNVPLKFGLSSMQGWRVHMEDAHIAEGNLYAAKPAETTTATTTSNTIPLKGHSLFAVYDGHGGTFAAQYAGRNFLRILSKQPKWIEYATLLQKEETAAAAAAATTTTTTKDDNETKQGMSAVHRELLEAAMRQAFVETDYEIALAIRGSPHPEANQPYHTTPAPQPPAAGASKSNNDSNDMESGDEDDDDENNDSGGTSSAAMEAASRAAADHVSALDDEGDSGTTACVVLITPTSILCANAGDSRAVYSKKSTTVSSNNNDDSGGGGAANTTSGHVAIALSFDHKPDDQSEDLRIRLAGGYVAGGRVEGDLAVSRGLGDFRFKEMPTVMRNMDVTGPGGTSSSGGGDANKNDDTTKSDENTTMDGDDSAAVDSSSSSLQIRPPGEQKVSPVPDFIVHARNNQDDEFVIVACDGIWDVRSNQECVLEVAAMYQEGESDLGLVSEELLDRCLHLGSKDNMTAIVIQMPGLQLPLTSSSAPTSTANTTGVIGRRRKRETEAAAQEQRMGADDMDHDGASSDDDEEDDAMWAQGPVEGHEELEAVFQDAQEEGAPEQ